jgi:molecular chaperone DnaK (HSP70)
MSASEHAPRFIVGIDLGTTNCALAFIDTAEKRLETEPSRAQIFSIPQLVAPGEIEARETLPSFHYQPAPNEFDAASLRLSWQEKPNEYFVGIFAREQGASAPGRLIHSAKSWLSYAGVDRTAELLPWHGAPDVKRISPVEASARYLRHLREAWNFENPNHPLERQEVVITIPASFDEVARELTVSAAQRAGLPRIVLLEEPQAAFYAWMQNRADEWNEKLKAGDKILVCDIGGGTSDFTLIQARFAESGADGNVRFHRIAVGEHLILGGDNLDLALAHFA